MDRIQNRLQRIVQHLVTKHHHNAISTNFDILRHVIEGHIVTEDKLLKYNDKAKEHIEKHAVILRKVAELEIELKEHIKLYKVHRL